MVKEIEEKETATKGGILLPKSVQEKPIYAEVVSVGPGGFIDGEEVKMVVKEKDKVLYSKFSGSEFKIENETYVILKQADILAIVED